MHSINKRDASASLSFLYRHSIKIQRLLYNRIIDHSFCIQYDITLKKAILDFYQLKKYQLFKPEYIEAIDDSEIEKEVMAKEGYDPVYGARPLKRKIQDEIEDKLAEEIIAGNIKAGDKVVVSVKKDSISISK